MNLKKYMMLVVGCGIALVLSIAAAVLLIQQLSASSKAQDELKSMLAKLGSLNKRQPFPSQANVEKTQKNLDGLLAKFNETQARLRSGQMEPTLIEPAQFGPLLEKTIRQLKQEASANGITLPENFSFGFGNYSAGALPLSNAIPRLVTQLRTVAALTKILYAAKITNVVALTRDEFEENMARDVASSPGQTGGSPFAKAESRISSAERGASATLKAVPDVQSNELYSVERFAIEFAGRENAVWEAFNSLVKGPPFAVIRDVSIESSTSGTAVAPGSSTRIGFSAGHPTDFFREQSRPGGITPSTSVTVTNLAHASRDDRVIAGREPVRATIVLDVFRFAAASKEDSK